MRERAEKHGVAQVRWEYIGDGDYAAIAHGMQPRHDAGSIGTAVHVCASVWVWGWGCMCEVIRRGAGEREGEGGVCL
jgi:hypothetical protein